MLARPPPVSSAPHVDILVIEVGEQRYGLLAADVEKIERAVTIVPLPGAPAVVEGLIDVRGAAVPVLDLRRRFRLPPRPVAPTDHLVLALAGGRRVAVRADRALELRRVATRDIEDAAATIPGIPYVSGVATLEDGLLLIHDLQTFLAPTEDRALDAALPARVLR